MRGVLDMLRCARSTASADDRDALLGGAVVRLERICAATEESGNAEALLRAILEHSPHGIVVCNAQGKLIIQNPAARRIWEGLARAESMAEWRKYRAFHPDGRPYEPQDWPMARSLSSGLTISAEEVHFQRFDDTHGILLASCAPILGPNGQMEGAVSVFADVTVLRQAEQELVRMQQRAFAFTADLQQLTAMLLIADSREDIARIIVRDGARVFGAEGASVYVREGEQFLLLAAEGIAAEIREQYANVPLNADLPMCDAFAASEERWYGSAAEVAQRYPAILPELAAARFQARAMLPLRVAGPPFGVLVADFGEIRAFDEEERQKLRTLASLCAQAIDRARLLKAERDARRFQQRLIGMVSHDLRTPLMTVSLACTILAKGQLDERQQGALSRTRHAIDGMGRMVGELVEYTHTATSGKMLADRRAVDLDEICCRVLAAIAPVGRVIYQHGRDGTAFWDGALIERLLENLLKNALHYGTPEIPVNVRWRDEGNELVLEVHNRGEPIPTNLLPRIFDPFRRATERRGNEGLGLGLYIVRQIVDAHGGGVSVHSTAEEGTTFTVAMPRASSERPAVETT